MAGEYHSNDAGMKRVAEFWDRRMAIGAGLSAMVVAALGM
jgi:hypothetical protein